MEINFYALHELMSDKLFPKLHLQWEYDNSTFSLWLMSEVAKDLAKELDQWTFHNPEQLPFHDLFAHEKPTQEHYAATRTVIPFSASPEALSILNKIKQAGLVIDFKAGTVANGKRIMRLGKYILNKMSPFTYEEREWWNHAGQATAELEATHDNDQYAIVVSRNPIDIVRMSDHDGWTSCHAPGREYFQCAISDAKGAGAIAYVVKKEDLDKVDLQAPEIFKDSKRRIDGVSPISRVRLRKFVHKEDKFDLAVPENRTYGKKFPGLEDSIREWALKTQLPKLEKHGYGTPEEWKATNDTLKAMWKVMGKQRPRMKDFQLMGGSYQDTQGSELFNYFFDDDLDSGSADYGGEDEYNGMMDQYEEEVEQIEREYRDKFTICSFYASVEDGDGGNPYVSYGGDVTLEIPNELMLPMKNKTNHDSVKWTDTPEYKARETIRQWARENGIYGINDVDINGNEVRISLYDDNGMDPDSFRDFLAGTLTDIEDKKDALLASLYHLFVELGFAKENKVKQISNNWDDHPHQFQNFKWEGDDPEVMISLVKPIQLPPAVQNSGGYQYQYSYWQNQFQEALMKELNVWADNVLAAQKQQPNLFQEPEFQINHQRAFSGDFKIMPYILITPTGKGNNDVVLMMTLSFETFSNDEHVEDAINFITFLDKNYQKFVSLVHNVYNKVWGTNWGKSQPQPKPQQQPQQTTPQPEKTWHQKNYPQMYGPDGQMLPARPTN